jgi:hypothetical protein
MIEQLDRSAVCGHCKAKLSEKVPDPMLQRWIGRLNSLGPDSFEQVAKDLATVFTNAFQGNFIIPQEEIPHLRVKGTTQRFDRDGNPVEGNLYKEEVLNIVLSLPFSEETDDIFASLTNLKSACVIKTLSRSEKDKAYSSIAHKTFIDAEFLLEWQEFVEDYTDYLIVQLDPYLSVVDEYTPLWMAPSADKSTSYINKDGKLCSAKKGDLRSMAMYNLKHPDVNRIAKEYPDEFASATLLGFPVIGAKFDLPEPFQGPLPVGRVALSPKRAQKPRIVFIPLAVLDSMSRPAFQKITQLYVWNVQGVESHDDSRRFVQKLLIDNPAQEEIWSFDQSAFTDNFDYNQIQRPILLALKNHRIINDYDLAVIDTINNGDWDADILRPNKYVKFGCGTGMGTPPSFPLASVGNGYLYAYAYTKAHGKFPDPRPNVPSEGIVVGDDLCIRGSATAQEYLKLCDKIGLQVNTSKSMHSKHVAEFCGKLISANGIFDKRKLIDVQTYAGLADMMDYYQMSMDMYLESFPNLVPLAEQIRKIPRPFGVAEPIDLVEHAPVEELTTAQQVTLLNEQASKLIALQRDGQIPSPREWTEMVERKRNLPHPEYELDVSTPKDTSDVPREPDGFTKAVIENAVSIYRHASVRSLDELQQAAATIDRMYRIISEHTGGELRLQHTREHVTLTRKRDETELADALYNIVTNVSRIETPISNEKGGLEL